MSAQTGRKVYGETANGAVVMLSFAGSPDDGGRPTAFRYEVRCGAHTIGSFATEKEADTVAKALAGAV